MESLPEAAVAASVWRRSVGDGEEAPLLLPPLFLAAAQAYQESIKKSLLCPAGKPSLAAPRESADRKGKKMVASFPVSGDDDCTGKSVACSSSSRDHGHDKGFVRSGGDGDGSGQSEVTKTRPEIGAGKTSLQIRVIDGTLLIEPLCDNVSRSKKAEGSRSRSRRPETEAKQRKCRARYTREEMEGLRFANVTEQRKLWCFVYGRLGGAVRREYEGLSMEKKHHCNNFRQRFEPTAPAILAAGRYCVGGARQSERKCMRHAC